MTKKSVSLKDLRINHLPLHFFDHSRGLAGCGINTIALLTGEDPKQLARRYRVEALDFKDEKLLAHLKRKGFQCHKIELNSRGLFNDAHLIEKNHVLLISVRMRSSEGSWAILYNGRFYHNFEVTVATELTFVNCPIMSAYVIFNRNWK